MALFLLLSVSLSASDEVYTPQQIPAAGVMPFILYYQQFLRVNPFAVTPNPKTPEEKAENLRRHQKAAELYAAMSIVAAKLAQSEDLLPAAPANIEKEKSKRVKGSWNLYHNVPFNAADLRQESFYMKYLALSHETSLAPNMISALHDFVDDLEEDADLQQLFQELNRDVCFRALSSVSRPLYTHAEKPETLLSGESALGKQLALAVQWYAPFVQKYPNEENLKLVDSFLETIELFFSYYPHSECVPEVIRRFRIVFADIQNQQIEPVVREYAEIYEGTLRRRELLDKMMPIWGADLSGKPMDEKTLEGKVVLLDFWATWCGPCIAEFPHLKMLYQQYKDKGFEIVSYSVDSDQRQLHTYLMHHPLPWIVLSKGATESVGLPPLSRYYGAKSLPVVLLRDRTGKALLLDARGQKLDDVLKTLFK